MAPTWKSIHFVIFSSFLTENEKPSSAKSDTTDVRQRQVSFEVGRQGKLNNCGQPLRIVQSSPSLKKGSPTRKLSFGKEHKSASL